MYDIQRHVYVYPRICVCVHRSVDTHVDMHEYIHTHLPPYTLFVHVDVYFFSMAKILEKKKGKNVIITISGD